jgi:hypothetical protein
MDDERIDTDTMAHWWGQSADHGIIGGGARIGAAIWSGTPR